MDIDAFSASRRDQWDRLDELTRRRTLSGAQADELVSLYRGAARDLSRVRTQAPDPQVLAELSRRVAGARGKVTGTRELRASDARRYLLQTVPAALYRQRWWTVGVMAVEIAIAVIVAVWTLRSPEAMSALGSPSKLDAYANEAFESYYSTYDPGDFASQVWTNNARLAVICVASGITGFLPAYVLWVNAVSLGQAAAIMADHGLLGHFFALISPHGLLELTCVFIAGGAGLRPRGVALAEAGRALIAVAVAMTGALAVAGAVEAFVTPAPVPWVLKVAVGVLVLAVLWAYTLVIGGRAARAGVTGDLDEEEAGAVGLTVG